MQAAPLIAAALLVAASAPALRAVASQAFRRVFPYDAALIGAVVALYLAGVAALAFLAPRALVVAAGGAVVVLAAVAWRSRPAYGVAAGLPPGSLWPLPVAPWADTEFFARRAERYGAVFKMSQFGRPMACVVGLERANRLLLAHDDALYAPPLPFSRFIEGGYLRYLPEERHLHYRRLFGELFSDDVVARAEPRLAAVFREGLDAMASAGSGPGGVRVAPAVRRMVFRAWTELFFGIDAAHPDFVRLKQLSRVIDIRKARWASARRVRAALAGIEAILRRRAEHFTHEVPDRCFLAALLRTRPDALDDRTVLGNLVYVMQVSWGDVSGLLTWVFKMLDANPEWLERLAADPQPRELATRVVMETLRFEQSEHRYRRTAADLEVDGFRIPAGWLVRICVRESHRDPDLFADPERFDPDRFVGRTYTRAEYAPFGVYRLACIGESLTKAVASCFACELASGYRWQTLSDGPPEIGSWAHNAPSPRWAVELAPRTEPA